MNVATVPLGELCEIFSGFAWSASNFNQDKRGVPIIRIQNVDAVLGNDFVYWDEPYDERFVIRQGDLLLTLSGSFRIESWSGPNALLNQRIVKLTPSPKLDRGWLLHVLRTRLGQIERLGKHALVNNVSLRDIRNLAIPMPPLAEQRRIAEVLDRAEALRAKRRDALDQLDSLTQSIFLNLFGDPVINPKKWPRKPLFEVGALDRGASKHRPRNAAELLGGPYPLVQTSEVANCNGYIREYHSTYSEIGLRQSKMWPAGTLCITIAANIAKTGILTFDACFPDSIVGFRAEDSATVEFVRGWLSFLQKSLEDAAPESAQKNINLALLRNLAIPLPPIPLQREFARRVASVEKLKVTQRASLAEMDALFASLQHRAFRGEFMNTRAGGSETHPEI